jgi:hypothetical protein
MYSKQINYDDGGLKHRRRQWNSLYSVGLCMIFASRCSIIIYFLTGVTYGIVYIYIYIYIYIYAFILPSSCYTSNSLNLYYGGDAPEFPTRQRVILNHFHGFLSLVIS